MSALLDEVERKVNDGEGEFTGEGEITDPAMQLASAAAPGGRASSKTIVTPRPGLGGKVSKKTTEDWKQKFPWLAITEEVDLEF